MAATSSVFRATDGGRVWHMTYSTVIKRFLLAGLAGGAVFAVWLWLVGEPVIREALAFEETLPSKGPSAPEMFSRSTKLVGGMLAGLVFGVILAFLLGTVYAAIRHRIIGRGDQIAVLATAGLAFLLTAVVPAIKYPANPPGIGHPDTLFKRSLAYFTLIVACLVVFAAVAVLFGWLKGRVDGATRLVVTVVVGVLAIAVVMLIWPDTNDPLPEKISALMVWSFRVRSLGGLALYWGVVGLLSGWLLSRVSASSVEKSETTASPAPSSAAAPN